MNSSSPRQSSNNRLIIPTAIALVVILVVSAGLYYWWYKSFTEPWKKIEHRQHALLYGTDHQQLQDAMRAIWNAHGGSKAKFTEIPIDSPEIKWLDAHVVFVHPSGMSIELGGQWCHYGFEAVFTDQADPDRILQKAELPSREVASGLWYYAENGIVK